MATGSSTIRYSYAPGNKRVWRGGDHGARARANGSDRRGHFLERDRAEAGDLQLTTTLGVGPPSPSAPAFYATQTACNYYFGGRLIKNGNGNSWVYSDRLGSIGKFYPYGMERPSATTNGTEKFTGYFRDSESGNDYAVNRYMSPGMGRFITPDRGMGGAKSADPGTWNEYAYVGGDPINRVDHKGLLWQGSGEDDCVSDASVDCVFNDDDNWPGACGVIGDEFFGSPVCYQNGANGGAGGAGGAPAPTCAGVLSSIDPSFSTAPGSQLTNDVTAVTWRIVNENSFAYLGHNSLVAGDVPNPKTGGTGPLITWSTLQLEDVDIASAIVNLANTTYRNKPAWMTIIGAANQGGTWSVAPGIITAAVLNGSPDSAPCGDIILALGAAQFVLESGSQTFILVQQLEECAAGGRVVPPTGASSKWTIPNFRTATTCHALEL